MTISMIRLALATCRNLPEWEVDDVSLHEALLARDVTLFRPAWDDRSFRYNDVDACLIRTTWDYQKRRDAFVDWARRVESCTHLFNPAAIVEWNSHKTYLRDLQAWGVPTIDTIWLERGTQPHLREMFQQRNWTRGFIKPAIGSTAWETLRFDVHDPAGIDSAQRHVDRLIESQTLLLQPYLARVETEGEVSVIFIDGNVTHCVQKIPQPGDYRVQDDFAASDRLIDLPESELTIARQALQHVEAHFNMKLLYARADFLRDASGNLCLNEFEAVEPSLFFRHCNEAAAGLADALLARLAPTAG
ncbi:MAG: ATP-grasp domain-containing protein [Phycisphaerales bacterium]